MSAELIIISGSLTGTRSSFGEEGVELGRAPSASIPLADAEAAWRHCAIRGENGRYRIVDLHTAGGTYVNGMRVTSRWLQDGDQISVGETVLVFREAAAAPADSPKITLLRACTLLFLFRGLATSNNIAQQELLESHVVGLLTELVGCKSAEVIIAANEEELRGTAVYRGFENHIQQALQNGPFTDVREALVAVPVYAAGLARGLIVAKSASDVEETLDILSSVSTLASVALENAREVQALKFENEKLQQQLVSDDFGIVGKSGSMRRLLQVVRRVAAQETTVLILGESGTGKELIARALHQGSPRRAKPFVAINCAALTETLLESELFGHEKGAFTGAVAQKKGKLESAEGGTVFLDEIGEMAMPLQAKLLRVLQEREFERVGGTKTHRLDVRLLAATNRDLMTDVRSGKFREDLYHRLNVVALQMPPLRERPEDIPLLAEHFLRKSARRMGRAMAGISPEAERVLIRYSWPGNVR